RLPRARHGARQGLGVGGRAAVRHRSHQLPSPAPAARPSLERIAMKKIDHALYLRLLDQAHAVATYHQHLIDCDLAPPGGGDDRDALECAADHVAQLAGYSGVEANDVSDVLWRGLRKRMGRPARFGGSHLGVIKE